MKVSGWGLPEDALDFLKEFEGESDRAAAVLGAAYLDECLKQLIVGFLIDDSKAVKNLLGDFGVLGSFSAKIEVSYCMGLLREEEYHNLRIIKKIRNRFAHRLHGYSFSEASVRDMCSELRDLKDAPPLGGDARSQFMTAVAFLVVALDWRTRLHKAQRRVVPPSLWG